MKTSADKVYEIIKDAKAVIIDGYLYEILTVRSHRSAKSVSLMSFYNSLNHEDNYFLNSSDECVVKNNHIVVRKSRRHDQFKILPLFQKKLTS